MFPFKSSVFQMKRRLLFTKTVSFLFESSFAFKTARRRPYCLTVISKVSFIPISNKVGGVTKLKLSMYVKCIQTVFGGKTALAVNTIELKRGQRKGKWESQQFFNFSLNNGLNYDDKKLLLCKRCWP